MSGVSNSAPCPYKQTLFLLVPALADNCAAHSQAKDITAVEFRIWNSAQACLRYLRAYGIRLTRCVPSRY
jgi:hypothetical protein